MPRRLGLSTGQAILALVEGDGHGGTHLPQTRPSQPPNEALALKLGAAMAEVIVAAMAHARAEIEASEQAKAPANKPGRPEKAMEPPTDPSRLAYTIEQAAEVTGVSVSGIWRRIKDGDLTTFKWAGRTLIRADVLQAAIDRATTGPE